LLVATVLTRVRYCCELC